MKKTSGVRQQNYALRSIHNTKLMARINTRDSSGNLRLFTSMGGIFPNGNFVPYFAAPFEPLGNSTPGNTVLKEDVQNVVGSGVTLPVTVNFDDDTALLLDSTQKLFTPSQVVQLAQILKLNLNTPAATSQATQAQDSAKPTPSWQEIFEAH